MVSYTGYVTQWTGTEKSKKGTPVARLLLSNIMGTTLQVQAWGPQSIQKLEKVAAINNIVKVDGAKLLCPDRKSIFNQGTVSRELRVEFHTKIQLLGVFNEEARRESISNVTLATLVNHQGLVRVEGKVLVPIRKVKTINEREYGCGAIFSGDLKLELRVLDMPQNYNELQIGQTIAVEGKLVKRTIPKTITVAPAYFEIQKLSNVSVTNAEPVIESSDLVKKYNYVHALV